MELTSARPLREAVELALDQLRPALLIDGGNIELLAIDQDGTVRVSFQGACVKCPAQRTTLQIGIEEPLRRAIPGVTAVISV